MSFGKDFLRAAIMAAITVVTGGATLPQFLAQTALLFGVNTYASHQQRKAARAAAAGRQEGNPNNITLRSVDYPEHIFYGKVRSPTILTYACTHTVNEGGVDVNYMTMVLAIPCRHELHAIDAILFDDYDIGTLSGGHVTTGKYFAEKEKPHAFSRAGTGVGTTYTLEHNSGEMVTPNAVDSIAATPESPSSWSTGESSTDYTSFALVPGVDYSVSGNTITLLTHQVGFTLTTTYRHKTGNSHVRVISNLAGSVAHDFLDLTSVSNGEWSAADDLDGVPNLVVRLRWDAENTMWAGGNMPNITAILRGKRLYDPKKDSTKSAIGGSGAHRYNVPSTWEYSDRSSLAWRDYMQNEFKCTEAEIDDVSVIAAGPVCDALVPINGSGGTEYAFTTNGAISTADEHWVSIEKLAVAMMGNAVCTGGTWKLVPFSWVAPVGTLDIQSLSDGEIAIDSRPGVENTTNCVRGKFVDTRATQHSPNGLFVLNDFPSYKSDSYINEDFGAEYWDDIELPMTMGEWRAQRIAKFYMFKARNALTVSATFNMDAYEYQPGDRVRLPWAMNGWDSTYESGTGKVFQILRTKYAPPASVELDLKEDASAYHAWSYTEAFGVDPSPNTSLPLANFVATLENVNVRSNAATFYVDQAGAVVPYVEITFDRPRQADVYVILYWKRAAETEYRTVRGAPGATYLWIEYISAGETLNAYLIAYNNIGAQSDPVWIPTIIVGTDVPASTIAVSANLLRNTCFDSGVVLGWTLNRGSNTNPASFQRHTSSVYYVAGSPSSAYVVLADSYSGASPNSILLGADELMAVVGGRTYVAYGGLIAHGCDSIVAVQWFDANSIYIPGADINSGGTTHNPVDPSALWADPARYVVVSGRAKAPDNARYAKFYVVLGGNFQAVPAKYVSLFKPFFGEIPANATGLPPWDPGTANPVGTGQLVVGAAATVAEFSDGPGFSIQYGNQIGSIKTLCNTTAQIACWVEITCTFECSGSAGGLQKQFSGALSQTGRYALVHRHALTVEPNTSDKNTMTLQATYYVNAGDPIAPVLHYSRTAGLISDPGPQTPNDRVYNIVTRVTIVKR